MMGVHRQFPLILVASRQCYPIDGWLRGCCWVHNGRHLVLFRDSFGSSLAPLLLGSFERITLVDLRYISAARLTDYADLSDATDVLYLCSTAVWNNGGTLRE